MRCAQGTEGRRRSSRTAYRAAAPRRSTTTACFAAGIKGRPVVLGYYFNSDEHAVTRQRDSRTPVLPQGHVRGAQHRVLRH